MTRRPRALERLLVCQRLQVIVGPLADDFADAWQRALDDGSPLPDELDLAQAAVARGVPILALNPLSALLQQCRRDRRAPDPGRLVETLVHGFAESRLRSPHACSCLVRRA